MRVVVVPPCVQDPGGHTTHSIDCDEVEYWLSYPHPEHLCCPDVEYVPASHGTDVLDPSTHALPAGHDEHSVRVVATPPLVKDPIGHVSQILAPASAYFLSFPHATHVSLPEAAKVPAEHLVAVPELSHFVPVGQNTQLTLVLSLSPPIVNDPAGHVWHFSEAASLLYLFGAPHG